MAKKIYGVMIVGTGWVSGEHIRAFEMNEHAEVRAIVSRSYEKGRAKADEYNLGERCKVYTDYDEALKDPNVDIVVICTPNDMHCEQTIKAAKAFKVTKNVSGGKVTYKKTSGAKKITVASNGKITVKKGLKAGKTYTVKVKATSKKTTNYKAASKTVTFKVKVTK